MAEDDPKCISEEDFKNSPHRWGRHHKGAKKLANLYSTGEHVIKILSTELFYLKNESFKLRFLFIIYFGYFSSKYASLSTRMLIYSWFIVQSLLFIRSSNDKMDNIDKKCKILYSLVRKSLTVLK